MIAAISSSSVQDELGAEIEADGTSVRFKGRSTTVVSCRLASTTIASRALSPAPASMPNSCGFVQMFGLTTTNIVGVGVDRLDYTKGIPERLEAIDRVLTRRPELRGRFTFVQIGVPSRSELESYGAIESEIDRKVAEVNARHAVPGGATPIYYHKSRSGLADLVALYRMAHFCVVSSLADGMNLVAKEFVASRDDEDGVLVLSALAGASEELREALIINPYDVDGFAAAITRAIDMSAEGARASHARRCAASWRAATSSAGRPTSSRVLKACGRNRCSTPRARRKTRRCEQFGSGRKRFGTVCASYWLAAAANLEPKLQ